MTRLLSITLTAALTLGAVALHPAPAAATTELAVGVAEAEQALAALDAFVGGSTAEEDAEANAVAQDIIADTLAHHGHLDPLTFAVEDAALRVVAGEDLYVVLEDFSHATPEIEDGMLRFVGPGEGWFDVSLPRWMGRVLVILIVIILI